MDTNLFSFSASEDIIDTCYYESKKFLIGTPSSIKLCISEGKSINFLDLKEFKNLCSENQENIDDITLAETEPEFEYHSLNAGLRGIGSYHSNEKLSAIDLEDNEEDESDF